MEMNINFKIIPGLEDYAIIGDVCNNKRKTCYGYKWKWKEESL